MDADRSAPAPEPTLEQLPRRGLLVWAVLLEGRQLGTVERHPWTRSRCMYVARDLAGARVAGDGGGLISRRCRAVAALVALDGRRRAAGLDVVAPVELDGLSEEPEPVRAGPDDCGRDW